MKAATVAAVLLHEHGITTEDQGGILIVTTPTGQVQVSDYDGDEIDLCRGFFVCRTDHQGTPAGADEGYVYASPVDDPAYVDGSDLLEMVAAVAAEVA